MMNQIRCTILLFAQLRDAVGSEKLIIELPAGATGDDLLNALARQYPAIEQLKDHLALAVDDHYQQRHEPLQNDQTIALIPPVSGG